MVYVLTKCIDQSEYTEPHYYCEAGEYREVIGVYSTYKKAHEEEERQLKILGDDDEKTYFDIDTYEIQ